MNQNIGLTQEKAKELLEVHGRNILPEGKTLSTIELFLKQFLSPFIYILLVAGIVSYLLGQISSAVFILVVLILNAIIGTVQEYSAQKSANALRSSVKGTSRIIRNGVAQTIDTEEIVPGDLVYLASGDKVPADLELIDCQSLSVDESMLTGESLLVSKKVHASSTEEELQSNTGLCFAGSIVNKGRGQGIVIRTAQKTEIGKIAKTLTDDRLSEAPLTIRIRKFTHHIAMGIIVSIIALASTMLLKGGYNFESILLMCIGLAVSTIPEGLPAALTVALATGMNRMAKENVIIRKLIAVESLGSCTFICSDKTGTLTVNELTIKKVKLPSGEEIEISGEGVSPSELIVGQQAKRLIPLATTGVLANESHLNYAGKEWSSEGDIVDVAFLVLAKKLDLSLQSISDISPQDALIPYESENAYSASLNTKDSKQFIHAKGSPEVILKASSKMLINNEEVEIDKKKIEAQFKKLALSGYRVIALARKEQSENESFEVTKYSNLTFLGLAAMIDPIRPEAKSAIASCLKGGIGVAMITGDHPDTAKAISLDLGLCSAEDKVVSGSEIEELLESNPKKLQEVILKTRVFARIAPLQKEMIVKTFMDNGEFVAVTGDGVNDAAAMRQANVGIAMGKRGTDVAKEAADLIITDDNFSSIVKGIEQGRVVYNNIKKVIGLLIATGFSIILLYFLCVLFGLPMPMIAVQLLWLNLAANGLQDVALAFEKKEGNELS